MIRKGRENYLCLLNFQEAVMRTGLAPENAVGLGLLARWALASRDGDMIGGDCPAWLLDLLGRGRITPPRRPARRMHLLGLRALHASASSSAPSAAPGRPTS